MGEKLSEDLSNAQTDLTNRMDKAVTTLQDSLAAAQVRENVETARLHPLPSMAYFMQAGS